MTVFIFLLIAIAAYYFMKKNMQKTYNVEFVRKIKWIIRAPILQIIFLGTSILFSVFIFIDFLMLNVRSSDFIGDFTSNSYLLDVAMENDNAKGLIRSSQYFDSLGIIAFVVSILAALGLILFIVMVVRQIRGIFGISDVGRVKKAHRIALFTYAIVTFCSMIYYLDMAMCVSDSGYDSDPFAGYIGLFARIVFFAIVILLFMIVKKKYNIAVDLFFETKEQEKASRVTETSQYIPKNNDNSKTKQLLELKGLLDKGLLTQDEFDSEKKKILNS